MKFVEKVEKDGKMNELEQLRQGMNFESLDNNRWTLKEVLRKKWNLEKTKARKLIVDELRDAGPVFFFFFSFYSIL